MMDSKTAHDSIERLTKNLCVQTGEEFKFGYIGNVEGIEGTPAYRDSRRWSIFFPHPGRIGGNGDNLGYVRTENLDLLRERLLGVLHFINRPKS